MDKKILSSPKALEKMKRIWLRSEVPLNLKFTSGPRQPFEIGEDQFGVEYDPDCINLLMIGNTGDKLVPLSGWMIAHRLSHAMIEGLKSCEQLLRDSFNVIIDTIKLSGNQVYSSIKTDILYLLWSRFDFRSARMLNDKNFDVIGGAGELFHELFAKFILSGDLVFRPLSKGIISIPNPNENIKLTLDTGVDVFNQEFHKFCKNLKYLYKQILDNGVGKCYAI